MWPKRKSLIFGEKNMLKTPLVNPEKVCLISLHIKLGVIKKICESNRLKIWCMYVLEIKFPKFINAKFREGIIIQVRALMDDQDFGGLLNLLEKQPGSYPKLYVEILLQIIKQTTIVV